MKNGLRVFEKLVFFALVLLFPTQLTLHFWPEYSFVFGIGVDYLSPSVYLTDIFVAVLIFLWVWRDGKNILKTAVKYKYQIFIGAFLIFLNIVFAVHPEVAFYRWVKLAEFFLFSFYVSRNVNVSSFFKIAELIFISLVPSIFLGVYNFFFGRTYGGLFYFLGERTFDISTPGIALVQFFGRDFVRPYGTFSHPNSLAGFAGILILLSVFGKFRKTFLTKIIFFITVIVFLIACSMSAYMGLLLALIGGFVVARVVFKKHVIRLFFYGAVLGSVVFMVASPRMATIQSLGDSVSERIGLAVKSLNIISTKSMFGVGLGNFVSAPAAVYNQWVNQSALQPVHNVFLLLFSETGLLIFIPTLYLINLQLKKASSHKHGWFIPVALFVLSTGLLDHYWLTLQQNLLLLSFLAGVSLIKK